MSRGPNFPVHDGARPGPRERRASLWPASPLGVYSVEGMAQLDCELMVTNALEYELPGEGSTRRACDI